MIQKQQFLYNFLEKAVEIACASIWRLRLRECLHDDENLLFFRKPDKGKEDKKQLKKIQLIFSICYNFS